MAVPLRDSLSDHDIAVGSGSGPAQHGLPLLVVDDDPSMVRALRYYFSRRRFRVIEADSLANAKSIFAGQSKWALVIADHHLPDGKGWDFYCWIRERSAPVPPFLLISGAADAATYADRVEFLAKPFSLDELDGRVGALLTPGG